MNMLKGASLIVKAWKNRFFSIISQVIIFSNLYKKQLYTSRIDMKNNIFSPHWLLYFNL